MTNAGYNSQVKVRIKTWDFKNRNLRPSNYREPRWRFDFVEVIKLRNYKNHVPARNGPDPPVSPFGVPYPFARGRVLRTTSKAKKRTNTATIRTTTTKDTHKPPPHTHTHTHTPTHRTHTHTHTHTQDTNCHGCTHQTSATHDE